MSGEASFTSKRIEVRVTLGRGMFGADLGNTKVISGLRVSCDIEKAGQPSKNQAHIKIYGLREEDMNAMSPQEGRPLAMQRNVVQVLAGDDAGMSVAFIGDITEAWASYRSPPNLYFRIKAIAGYYPSLAPSNPKSYRGGTPVAVIMKTLADEMGYAFEDRGVDVLLASPYMSGTGMQQAQAVAEAANIEFGVDDGVLFIAPRGLARRLQTVPLISAATGMKEYPIYGKKGLEVTTLYNPNVTLGGLVKVESVVPNARGTWRVNGLKHRLECEKPGADWFTKIKAVRVGAEDEVATSDDAGEGA